MDNEDMRKMINLAADELVKSMIENGHIYKNEDGVFVNAQYIVDHIKEVNTTMFIVLMMNEHLDTEQAAKRLTLSQGIAQWIEGMIRVMDGKNAVEKDEK